MDFKIDKEEENGAVSYESLKTECVTLYLIVKKPIEPTSSLKVMISSRALGLHSSIR